MAEQLAENLSAYNATDDLVPYFGDCRLPHTEALYQLKNSVCLAFHGFYSQAFTTLRAVCELSLLQAALPEGDVVSDRQLEVLQSTIPFQLPREDEVNWVLPIGLGAAQTPGCTATTLAEWAVDGCRTPQWQEMLRTLLDSSVARDFDSEAQWSTRLRETFAKLDSYVHPRGRLHSAVGLSSANELWFSSDSLIQYAACMLDVTRVSIAVLMITFLPSATKHPEAAAGFIDPGDLSLALRVLPQTDARFLRGIYDGR